MTRLTLSKPKIGEANPKSDPKIDGCFESVETWGNGQVDTTNFKETNIEEGKFVAAVKTKLGETAAAGLKFKERTANFEAEEGELAFMNKSGIVAKLPSPITNNKMIVGFVCNVTEAEIEAVGGRINGDYVTARRSVTLLEFQHLTLKSDGANWQITGGQGKRTQQWEERKYTKAELEGVVFSETRPVLVTLTGPLEKYQIFLTLNGKAKEIIPFRSELPKGATVTLWINPGQKLEMPLEPTGAKPPTVHVLEL